MNSTRSDFATTHARRDRSADATRRTVRQETGGRYGPPARHVTANRRQIAGNVAEHVTTALGQSREQSPRPVCGSPGRGLVFPAIDQTKTAIPLSLQSKKPITGFLWTQESMMSNGEYAPPPRRGPDTAHRTTLRRSPRFDRIGEKIIIHSELKCGQESIVFRRSIAKWSSGNELSRVCHTGIALSATHDG